MEFIHSENMKILVTGASGLLGREVYKVFKEAGVKVSGIGYSRANNDIEKVDLTSEVEVEAYLRKNSPNIIIHSAAYRFPDKIENDFKGTLKLNVDSCEYLCKIASELGAYVIYISTDYVFDGSNPPYLADDKPNPLNKYGHSKLLGERKVLDAGNGHIILRIPILYGDVEYIEESAITVLYKALVTTCSEKIQVSDYEIRRPSHVNDISKILLDLCIKKTKDPAGVVGIYQWCGEESFTKYEMVLVMADCLGLPTDHIEKMLKPPLNATPRPFNTAMDTSKLKALGINHHTKFKDGINRVLGTTIFNIN